MWTKLILLLSWTIHISDEAHHPQVYEDQGEHVHNRNVYIRTVRNPESTYRTIHQPPTFSYDAAKQQDKLKHRYAQQQKVDLLRMSKRYPKTQKYLSQPVEVVNSNQVNSRLQGLTKSEETGELRDLIYLNTEDRPDVSNLENNNVKSESDDLSAEESNILEDKLKIDRQDAPSTHDQIIYMHPSFLKQNFDKNSQNKVIMNYNANIKKPDTQLSVLNELIGKNPNVQLEGLKRLLQETPNQNFIAPVVRGPQPFQIRHHTPPENLNNVPNSQSIPNIQVNHVENSMVPPQVPQIPQLLNKESLADLQKQLDEHSRLQTEQVLARAQQEAQAHVEAQHKAIALAQAQAQKTALEKIQSSLYANGPAAPDVPQAQALVRSPPRPTNVLPTPTSKEVHYSNHKDRQQTADKRPLPTNGHQNSPINSQASTYTHVIDLPPANNPLPAGHKNIPLHAFGTKNLQYYAPNHQHQQAVDQSQVHLAHIQNIAALQPHVESLTGHHDINVEGAQVDIEDDRISGINSLAQPEPTASTYQQFVLETNPSEQEDHEETDELQYAAKYAFGYRIKDQKEGNDFGHEERRNGKSAEGSYHVLLPDGRLQKVQYYADNSGYHAKVTYEHVAHH